MSVQNVISLVSSEEELSDDEIKVISEVKNTHVFSDERTITFTDEKILDEINNQFYLNPEDVLRIVYYKSSNGKIISIPKELDQIDGKIYLKVKSLKAEELLDSDYSSIKLEPKTVEKTFQNKLTNNQEDKYVYVNSEKDFTKSWIKAHVLKKFKDEYLVENPENKKQFSVKYFSVASIYPPNEVLFKPFRIVAKIKTNESISFYSGTIAEFPKSLNKSRYLIFFENGSVAYVDQKNIFKIKDQSKNCNYFTFSFKSFIEYYYRNFPEIPLIKYKLGDKERINYKNVNFLNDNQNQTIEWVVGEVIEIDCNLVKFFLKQYNYEIWLFRGDNTRIYSLASQTERKFFFKAQSRPSRNLETSLHKTPQIEHENKDVLVIELSDNEQEQDSAKGSKKFDEQTEESEQNEFEFSIISFKNLYKNQLLLNPTYETLYNKPQNLFSCHDCNSKCLKSDLELKNTKGINMYLVPIIFGWKRFHERNIDLTKTISYLSPCGKIFYEIEKIYNYLIKTNSSIQIDQFSFEEKMLLDSLDNYEEKCFYFKENICDNQEVQPISVINCFNRTKLNINFKYIAEQELNENLKIPFKKDFMVCCDCEDNCLDLAMCQCQHLTIEGYKNIHNFSEFPLKYRLLSDKILSGYYECNENCKCKKSCLNRIVQLGTRNLLQVFKTFGKGWGVRCLNDIPKGAFVCKYSGVILDDEMANEEGEIYGDEYLADLDLIENCEDARADFEESSLFTNYKNINSESIRQSYGKPYMYVINGKLKGNIGRFLNHSCNPNLFVQNVFINTHDLRLPCVAFFAKKFIPAFVELTWDYNYQIGTSKKKIYCKCESDNCRIRLI